MTVSYSKDRRSLLKLYRHLYKKFGYRDDAPNTCIYCGFPGETEDHIPPVSWAYCFGADHFTERGIQFLKVPACLECNVFLGDKELFTIRHRTEELLAHYKKKYRRFLRHKRWSVEELDDLGYTLGSKVESVSTVQIAVKRRIQILEEEVLRCDEASTR